MLIRVYFTVFMLDVRQYQCADIACHRRVSDPEESGGCRREGLLSGGRLVEASQRQIIAGNIGFLPASARIISVR